MSSTHDDRVRRLAIDENPDVFDDEYAEDDPFVTNGLAHRTSFEPPIPTQVRVIQSTAPQAPRRSFSSIGSDLGFEQHNRRYGRNNGANDEDIPRDPFASSDDDSSSLQRTPSGYSQVTISDTPTLQNRSLSHTSSFSVAGSQSDFQGITGPSHPYAMYSQGVNVGRTPSVATTSTLHAPSRASSGTRGSTYAYGMYAQNTLADPEDRRWQSTRARMPMQMGVRGQRQPYHRRIGPDGEEQDIIGPEGHAEQLPPYSRYPDEEASKCPLPSSAPAATATDVPSEDGAEHASQQQPLLPADAHLGPRAPPEEPPVVRNASSGETTGIVSSGVSEKPKWSGRSWKERRRTKRFWLTVFGAILVIILAVIVGGVIGGLLVRNQQAAGRLSATVTPVATKTVTTSLYDASIIATPPSVTSLPTGSFQLPLKPVNNETRRGCLADQTQGNSWTCSLPGPPLDFTLIYDPASLTSSISISGGPQILSPVTYGSQPPTISVVDIEFVIDVDSKEMGPALFFHTTYDKIAVVGADEISVLPGSKRFSRRQSAPLAAGDRPWFCFWNQTFIQGYVYLGRAMPLSAHSTLSSTSTSSASSTSVPMISSTRISLGMTAPTTVLFSTSTAKPLPTASRHPYDYNNGDMYPNTDFRSYYPARAAASQRFGPYVPNGRPVPPYDRKLLANKVATTYPLIVKIEERRPPSNIPPYCQQMKILDDGGFNYALDQHNNEPVGKVTLQEIFPPLGPDFGSNDGVRKVRRDEPPVECHCQWVSE